jgi:periplasmic mercuric ion binding protein
MKQFVVFAALVALVSCANQEPEVIEIPTAKEVVAPVVANASSKMFVSGMTCVMGCKGAIEKKLNATEGVESFAITFEDSTAVVKFDSTVISKEEIIATVDGVAGGGLYEATLLAE